MPINYDRLLNKSSLFNFKNGFNYILLLLGRIKVIISNYATQLRRVYKRWILRVPMLLILFLVRLRVLLYLRFSFLSRWVKQLLISLVWFRIWVCCCVRWSFQRCGGLFTWTNITVIKSTSSCLHLLLENLVLQASCMVAFLLLLLSSRVFYWVLMLLRLPHHRNILVRILWGFTCVDQLIWLKGRNLNFILRLRGTRSASASQFDLSDVPAVR